MSEKVRTDIKNFIAYSLSGILNNHLAQNSLKKHDIDANGTIDTAEESLYIEKMTAAILQIIKL
jgi:hypothetical protein